MAESSGLTWKEDNVFIPQYIPNDLKWFERDGLDTWYLKNKSDEFLQNTDLHFKQRKIVNFDYIKNGIDEINFKQYNQIDHEEIKKYPIEHQKQIMSSMFRNANRKYMVIQKRTVDEHFKNTNISGYGRGNFIKNVEMVCMILVGN